MGKLTSACGFVTFYLRSSRRFHSDALLMPIPISTQCDLVIITFSLFLSFSDIHTFYTHSHCITHSIFQPCAAFSLLSYSIFLTRQLCMDSFISFTLPLFHLVASYIFKFSTNCKSTSAINLSFSSRLPLRSGM